MNTRLRLLAGAGVLVAAALTACGSDDDTAEAGSGGGGPSVEIVEPAAGADIGIPFTLTVEASEELGTTDEGLHHVHLYFDGDDSNYHVVEADTLEITADSPALAGVSPGEHVMNVSLRNADHSPAGAETEITVNVAGAGSPASDQPTGDDPYDY